MALMASVYSTVVMSMERYLRLCRFQVMSKRVSSSYFPQMKKKPLWHFNANVRKSLRVSHCLIVPHSGWGLPIRTEC